MKTYIVIDPQCLMQDENGKEFEVNDCSLYDEYFEILGTNEDGPLSDSDPSERAEVDKTMADFFGQQFWTSKTGYHGGQNKLIIRRVNDKGYRGNKRIPRPFINEQVYFSTDGDYEMCVTEYTDKIAKIVQGRGIPTEDYALFQCDSEPEITFNHDDCEMHILQIKLQFKGKTYQISSQNYKEFWGDLGDRDDEDCD